MEFHFPVFMLVKLPKREPVTLRHDLGHLSVPLFETYEEAGRFSEDVVPGPTGAVRLTKAATLRRAIEHAERCGATTVLLPRGIRAQAQEAACELSTTDAKSTLEKQIAAARSARLN